MNKMLNKDLLNNLILLIIKDFSMQPITIGRLTYVIYLVSYDYFKRNKFDFLKLGWEKSNEDLFSRDLLDHLVKSNEFNLRIDSKTGDIKNVTYIGGKKVIQFDQISHKYLTDIILQYLFLEFNELQFIISQNEYFREAIPTIEFFLEKSNEMSHS